MSERVALHRRLYQGWMLLVAHFGEVQTLVVVALAYVVAIGPMSLVASLGRRDLLDKRSLRSDGSAWNEADSVSEPDLERAKRLF